MNTVRRRGFSTLARRFAPIVCVFTTVLAGILRYVSYGVLSTTIYVAFGLSGLVLGYYLGYSEEGTDTTEADLTPKDKEALLYSSREVTEIYGKLEHKG